MFSHTCFGRTVGLVIEILTVGDIMDVLLLIERSGPMSLPLFPCVFVFWHTSTFMPIWDEASTL